MATHRGEGMFVGGYVCCEGGGRGRTRVCEGNGCGHRYLSTTVHWTPQELFQMAAVRLNQRQPFWHLSQPNRTPTLNQTRADAPVTGLDPAQMCTSLTDAYRRIYHGISDACWTRRKLQALSGQTRRTRGRSTAPESALNNSRQPQYGASLTWNTLFPGGGKYLDSLQLWHSPICISTAMSTRLKDTHSICI